MLVTEIRVKQIRVNQGIGVHKAELQQVDIVFGTQFPSLGFFINKKVGNKKTKNFLSPEKWKQKKESNFAKLPFLNDKIYSYMYKKHFALGNLAKLLLWSILSIKKLSFAKLLIFLLSQFLC